MNQIPSPQHFSQQSPHSPFAGQPPVKGKKPVAAIVAIVVLALLLVVGLGVLSYLLLKPELKGQGIAPPEVPCALPCPTPDDPPDGEESRSAIEFREFLRDYLTEGAKPLWAFDAGVDIYQPVVNTWEKLVALQVNREPPKIYAYGDEGIIGEGVTAQTWDSDCKPWSRGFACFDGLIDETGTLTTWVDVLGVRLFENGDLHLEGVLGNNVYLSGTEGYAPFLYRVNEDHQVISSSFTELGMYAPFTYDVWADHALITGEVTDYGTLQNFEIMTLLPGNQPDPEKSGHPQIQGVHAWLLKDGVMATKTLEDAQNLELQFYGFDGVAHQSVNLPFNISISVDINNRPSAGDMRKHLRTLTQRDITDAYCGQVGNIRFFKDGFVALQRITDESGVDYVAPVLPGFCTGEREAEVGSEFELLLGGKILLVYPYTLRQSALLMDMDKFTVIAKADGGMNNKFFAWGSDLFSIEDSLLRAWVPK
ncbi:MAG: hypothetical protein Q4G30_06680 [Actinomycetaceae bacterium]|nr:hypothetical protein [Actinomycetaceae bacterium]